MKRRVFSAALFLFAAGLAANESPRLSIADPDALNGVLDQYVDEQVYPFMYLRLEDRDGRLIHEYAAVNDELMDGKTVDGDSWMRIWSMSKIVTISTVLDLVEDGVLSLDDRVVEYIPEFKELKVAVSPTGDDLSRLEDKQAACPLSTEPVKYGMTVLDLINHRDGFYYPVTGIECLDAMAGGADFAASRNSQELIDKMSKLPLINQPGTTHFYGTGTTVLGLVAERATGKSLKQLVAERATGPLNISGLQYGLPDGASLTPRFIGKDGVVQRMTEEESLIFGSVLPDYDPEHELYLGGEGMVATADGYADFARMLLRRGELNGYRFLDEETVAAMVAPHTQLDNEFGHNGYNFWISNGLYASGEKGPAPLWIGGGYEGTYFWIDPEMEFVAVITTQVFNVPEKGHGRDEVIRKAVYAQLKPER